MRVDERFAPDDNQRGDPLAPVQLNSPLKISRPGSVITVGVDPQSYLNKAILCECFQFENVENRVNIGDIGQDCSTDTAWVVDNIEESHCDLTTFLSSLGGHAAVVDIAAFAKLAKQAGWGLRVTHKRKACDDVIHVFHRRMDAEVLADAFRVEVCGAKRAALGFGGGDCFHCYGREGNAVTLNVLANDEPFRRFCGECKCQVTVYARTSPDGEPAILVLETDQGGVVVVMDLKTVNRVPEASGAEGPAVHLFLAAIGKSTTTFGKFVTAYATYDDFLAGLESLQKQYADFTELRTVGHSEKGREMRLLSVRLDQDVPSILFTTGIHPLEWAPAYGILRYLCFLLEQCRTGTLYAREILAKRRFDWLVCACPDCWECRDQQENGINLNRNFPGSWEHCVPGQGYWDAYNRRFSVGGDDQLIARGPASGSQPETQVLMSLLEPEQSGLNVVTLVDFHETTAFDSFLHPPELVDGTVPDLAYHLALKERIRFQFNQRLYGNGNQLAYRPALNDFSSYCFRDLQHIERLIPGPHSGWLMYAAQRGIKGTVVEAAGCDCSNYQTIRRTEYNATVAEQLVCSEAGHFQRNPWNHAVEVTLVDPRFADGVSCVGADGNDRKIGPVYRHEGLSVSVQIPARGWVLVKTK